MRNGFGSDTFVSMLVTNETATSSGVLDDEARLRMLTFTEPGCNHVNVHLDLVNIENDGQEFGIGFSVPVDHCDDLASM